jgi:hypothetical protein
MPVVELPEHLRRDAVRVEQFVPWDEPLSSVGEDSLYPTYRRLLSWRRWQDAVTAWGAERGLDVPQLRALGLYPVAPPRFCDTSRLTGNGSTSKPGRPGGARGLRRSTSRRSSRVHYCAVQLIILLDGPQASDTDRTVRYRPAEP